MKFGVTILNRLARPLAAVMRRRGKAADGKAEEPAPGGGSVRRAETAPGAETATGTEPAADAATATGAATGLATDAPASSALQQVLDKPVGRRGALAFLAGGVAAAGTVAAAATGPLAGPDGKEKAQLAFQEYFKGNYRQMTDAEKEATVQRLERLSQLRHGIKAEIGREEAPAGVRFGYAFNISKCKGFLECVKACVMENNQDRSTNIQYIKIFEMNQGGMKLEEGTADFFHQVPVPGKFYMGTQCFQCENPPCVDVCPVGATWMEPDGIVVIEYDWCIGCRYCQAACPYWARRFNWKAPEIPKDQINRKQHYLGNRVRQKGVVEKCTFCLQRTRAGRNPACVEACPTGARVFGNLLDPDSEIRWVLANKKVFRLKEDLGTEPKFWYYMD